MRRLADLSKRVSGFKATIVEIDPDTGQPMLFWKSERKLHLPGAWSLSSLKKRGIPLQESFREVQRGPAPTASPRPVLSPATIVSARIARMAIALSGESSWDFRPRSTLRKSGSNLPLTVAPSVRPITTWELSVNCKWEKVWRGSKFLPPILGVLPEFPTFNLRSEEVVGPDYCSPLSGPICVTRWVRRSQLALPVDRSSRIQGLQTRGHLSRSPELAAWSTKFEIVTQVSEPGLTVAGLTVVGLNIMDSCRPVSARRSRAGVDMAEPLSAILDPSPTGLRSPIMPSLIRPNFQSGNPNSLSLLDITPSPRLFATTRQSCDAAIPEAETGTDGRRSRLWFAVRVPSPSMLETPTPLDTSKRLHYVHATRDIRFTAIPVEVVPQPARLPTARGQALGTAPDLFSDSAAFRTFERSLSGENVPEIPELLPPEAPVIQRSLAPADQPAVMAEPFLPHDVDRFPMGPAILWTSTFNEGALREGRSTTDRIRPVPDSIEESFIPHKMKRLPVGPAALSITTLNQAALRETGPTTNAIRPVPDGIAESFIPHKANRFGTGPAIQWTATVNEAVLREATAPMRGVHPVPDCPQVFVFQNRSRLGPSWRFPFATPTGASFATYAAQPYEPIGEPGGQPDADRVIMPESALKPWNKPAHSACGMEEMLGPVQVAPARASFREIAHPESMHYSLRATDLRNRIFNPILPQFPRTHLRPATIEVIEPRLGGTRVFAPVGFRWQRNRKVRDRGAPWKIPTSIGLHPQPAPPHWPGPLSVTERDDRPTRFH